MTMDVRCPRMFDDLPTEPCEWGRNKALSMEGTRNKVERVGRNECVWYINDESCCYCFFNYSRNKANYGKTLTLREIAKLYSTSINNIKLREGEAFANFLGLWDQYESKMDGTIRKNFGAQGPSGVDV